MNTELTTQNQLPEPAETWENSPDFWANIWDVKLTMHGFGGGSIRVFLRSASVAWYVARQQELHQQMRSLGNYHFGPSVRRNTRYFRGMFLTEITAAMVGETIGCCEVEYGFEQMTAAGELWWMAFLARKNRPESISVIQKLSHEGADGEKS